MKMIKNILLVAGLFCVIPSSYCTSAEEADGILGNINKWGKNPDSDWIPSGPTLKDIQAATHVENLAAKGSREYTFIEAVKKGDLKNVETLIALGVNLEARDHTNMTALMIAAQKGNADIVNKLINAGANIAAQGKYNDTALFYASESNNAEAVKPLMAHGASKNEKDFGSLFMSAVYKGNNEMVKALMVDGARIDNETLSTAYFLAQHRCSAEVVKAIKNLCNR